MDIRGKSGRVRNLDMKKSPFTMVLIGVIALLSVLSFIFCVWYASNDAGLRQANDVVNAFNQRELPAINSLANDAKQYSEKHPDIDPILIAAGVKQAKTSAK